MAAWQQRPVHRQETVREANKNIYVSCVKNIYQETFQVPIINFVFVYYYDYYE